MGWTAFGKDECVLDKRGRINKKATMDHEFERSGLRIVRSAMGGGNWYAVAQHTEGAWAGRFFLAVVLIETNPRAYGYEFAYKGMDDAMGPYHYECPKSILDLADELCPCTEGYDRTGYAAKWRAKCRDHIEEQESPLAFKNVAAGQSVVWHVPEESGLMMNGESIAGHDLTLTKCKGRRSWIHFGLWNTRVPVKYVSPKQCKLVA